MSPGNVLTMHYTWCRMSTGGSKMRKTTSISIRVSEEELEIFKRAADEEAYASYSEFVRRTALKEASRVLKEKEDQKGGKTNE